MWTPPALAAVRPLLPRVPTPATGGVGVREGAGWYEVGWWVGGLIGRWNFSQRICCIFIKMPIKICSIN